MSEQWRNRIQGYGEEDPEQLLANPDNWRIHPKYQQAVMAGVLDEVGFVQDVIVNTTTGHMVDGHLRVELAIRKGQKLVPVKFVELTEAEEAKILATFDPIGTLAGRDQELIDRLVVEISTEDEAVQDLLESLASEEQLDPIEKPGEGDDDVPAVRAKIVTQEGDVWLLGDHRLICGDCLDPCALEAVLQGDQADMLWTYPPSGADYQGDDFLEFMVDALTPAFMGIKDGGAFYIAHDDRDGQDVRTATRCNGLELEQSLVWIKNSLSIGRQDYQVQHEPILYGRKPGGAGQWYGEHNKVTAYDADLDTAGMNRGELRDLVESLRNANNSTVIRADKPAAGDTQLPVGLIIDTIRNSSKRGMTVLDLFAGSGATMMACQRSGRLARLVELDPKYCDVICRRYQKHSGQPALLEDGAVPFDEIVER